MVIHGDRKSLNLKSYSSFGGVYCSIETPHYPHDLGAKTEQKMRLHFTDLAIARLKELGEYHDDSTLGFGIRVGKNRKTWFVVRGRERLRSNVGQYPAKPLADARMEAKKLLTQPVAKGSRITFEEAATEYKEFISDLRERTQYGYKKILDRRLTPTLGKKKLRDLAYEDFTAITDNLKPSMKAHVLAFARIFLNWCVRPPRRYIPHSPLEGVEIRRGNKRKRALKPTEIKVVWEAATKQGYPHGTIVQLLLLNGQRQGETANLRWPWINEVERLITLPDWITKNGKEHTFPYGDMTASILETVPRLNSTDLLFPSRVSNERPVSGWSKFKHELDQLAGTPVEPWCLHDLRRTLRTTHGEIGTPSEIAERLINHAAAVQTEVEAIYDQWTYIPQMRAAVFVFEKHFQALLARAA
jgi:integrase